ncbi:hypothetical protein [Halarchaeum sp. P4]|uniref:hypothetical protein n=1 Tax=Halarchaeum sp. P4 TaxID=3421639 RepID=UPI003EB93DA7
MDEVLIAVLVNDRGVVERLAKTFHVARSAKHGKNRSFRVQSYGETCVRRLAVRPDERRDAAEDEADGGGDDTDENADEEASGEGDRDGADEERGDGDGGESGAWFFGPGT